MTQFKQKQISLVVGAALLAMAGTANAVVAPAARTAQPALITAITTGAAEGLLTTAGTNTAITIDLALHSGPAVATTGSTAGASTTVTVASTAGMGPGMLINGTGITAGTTIAAIQSGTALTLSGAMTVGAATALTATNAISTTQSGALTAASLTLNVASTTNMAVGQLVSGQGITPGTTVAAVASATALTLSAVATVPTASVITVGTAAVAGAAGANPTVAGTIAASAALTGGSGTIANDNVIVYTGTTATPVASAAYVPVLSTTASGIAHLSIPLPAPGAGKAYRLTAGVLEYCSNTAATTPVWAAVKVDFQKAAAGGATAIWSEIDGVAAYNAATQGAAGSAPDVTLAALTGIAVGNGVAPTPLIVTTGAPTAALPFINGISVDTVVPISAFTIVTSVAATPNDAAGQLAAIHAATPFSALPTVGAAFTATSATGTLGTAVAATATTPPTFKNTLAFLAAADWTSGAAADDLIYAASSIALNTGINGTALPIRLSAGSTPPTYTQVFNAADGLASAVSFAAGATAAGKIGDGTSVTDGVAPVLVTTANSGNTNLDLTFSEPMSLVGENDIREIAENVLLSGTFTSNGSATTSATLAAIAMNNGLTLTATGAGGAVAGNATGGAATAITPTNGQSTLSIGGLTTTELLASQTVTVNTGISFKEANDTLWSATVNKLDTAINDVGADGVILGGGIKSTSTAVEAASVTAKAVTPAVVTVAFNNATAAAQTTAADPAKVGQIIVTFPAGKEISLATGLTTANLVNQIRVTAFRLSGAVTKPTFEFFPSAAQMAINAAGTTLTITIPTDLIYAKMPSPTGMNVEYLPAGFTAGTLVKKASSAVAVASLVAADKVSANNLAVTMPFAIVAATNRLLTQSIIGTMTPASGSMNGDKVEAYVAKWVDAPTVATASATTIQSGTILGNQIVWSGTANNGATQLATDIDAELAKVAAAQAAVNGVSLATTAVAAGTRKLYYTTNYGKAYVSASTIADSITPADNITDAQSDALAFADAAALATNGSTAMLAAINIAAAAAGNKGAVATGASGTGITITGTNGTAQGATATSAAAAHEAGVAAAVAAVIGTANVPSATVAAASAAAVAPGATVASIVKAVLDSKSAVQVQTAIVDATGKITVTGVGASGLVLTKTAPVLNTRGLVFIKASDGTSQTTAALAGTWASGVVGSVNGVANSYNLLLGIEPSTADLVSKTNSNWFVLLVHTPSTFASPADLNMLTSADPLATNFMSFAPNLITGSGTRTTLATTMSKITKMAPATTTSWALYGLGNPSVVATAPGTNVASFPRRFVGIANATSQPKSFWTSDTVGTDMAMAMAANKVSVSTELGVNKDTLSTITPASFVPSSVALAWKNDAVGVTNDHIDVLQAATAPAAGTIKVGAGWSLVTVPTGMVTTVPTAVGAIIKVGSQVTSGYTWIKATDATTTPVPALTAGEAVFVFSTAGGAIN